MKLTFKQFLIEQETPVQDDVEDLAPEELEKRSMELKRQAQLKRQSPEMAKRKQMVALRQRLQSATDPRLKADLQRRIRELMSGNQQNETV